jgi:hypothetical protein
MPAYRAKLARSGSAAGYPRHAVRPRIGRVHTEGVVAEEIADDPNITQAVRAHAREVTKFVLDGTPAMMQQMMLGGMTSPGGMMGRG